MGREKGGWGLLLLPEDMAKLGQLYLQQGRWQGQQLIPKDWVRDSTKVQIHQKVDPTTTGYGYQIWTLEDGAFLFNGMSVSYTHLDVYKRQSAARAYRYRLENPTVSRR